MTRFDTERTAELEREIAALRELLREVVRVARDRIKDGDEMGGRVWRIALEDIANDPDIRTTLGGQP